MDPSLAKQRNADLRVALREAFPDTRFSVRNGRKGAAAVRWTDGPDCDPVREVCRAVHSYSQERRYAVIVTRHLSLRGMTLAYWRAQRAGYRFYTPPVSAKLRRGQLTGESLEWLDYDFDLRAPATPDEQNAVDLLLSLVGDHDYSRTVGDDHPFRLGMARVVHQHGPAIAASLLPVPG